MPAAFLLLNVEIGAESEVLEALKQVDAVERAYLVLGVYDIVAEVRANTADQLREIVSWQVRRLDKVKSTTTMVVAEGR